MREAIIADHASPVDLFVANRQFDLRVARQLTALLEHPSDRIADQLAEKAEQFHAAYGQAVRIARRARPKARQRMRQQHRPLGHVTLVLFGMQVAAIEADPSAERWQLALAQVLRAVIDGERALTEALYVPAEMGENVTENVIVLDRRQESRRDGTGETRGPPEKEGRARDGTPEIPSTPQDYPAAQPAAIPPEPEDVGDWQRLGDVVQRIVDRLAAGFRGRP